MNSSTQTEGAKRVDLPVLHRVKDEFWLMNSTTKGLVLPTHATLDELCLRSNAFPDLVAALQTIADECEKMGLAEVGNIRPAEVARAALLKAKA